MKSKYKNTKKTIKRKKKRERENQLCLLNNNMKDYVISSRAGRAADTGEKSNMEVERRRYENKRGLSS